MEYKKVRGFEAELFGSNIIVTEQCGSTWYVSFSAAGSLSEVGAEKAKRGKKR